MNASDLSVQIFRKYCRSYLLQHLTSQLIHTHSTSFQLLHSHSSTHNLFFFKHLKLLPKHSKSLYFNLAMLSPSIHWGIENTHAHFVISVTPLIHISFNPCYPCPTTPICTHKDTNLVHPSLFISSKTTV